MLKVEGPPNLLVYSGKEVDATYLGDYALPGGADTRVAALQSEVKKAIAGEPKHGSNGMYGLILVEPKEGLPPVDKEFYVMLPFTF